MKKLIIISLIFLLSSCAMWDQVKESTGITPETSSIELIITADNILNVRDGGQSSPVILRIHELNSPVLFRNLDFFALFENDKAALNDEYIKRHEYQIQPGEVIHTTLVLEPETSVIGFSVAFRNIDGATWRKVELIEEKSEYVLHLNLKESVLSTNNTHGITQIYF